MNAWHVLVLWTVMASVFVWSFELPNAFAQHLSRVEQRAEKLPADVHPETLSRMPQATRDEFTTEEDRQAYDELVAAEPNFGKPINRSNPELVNGTPQMGATGTRLHIPIVSRAYRTALSHLREKSGLEQRYRELAIMTANRESENEYEWDAHELTALKAGVPREAIEIIRYKRDTKGLEEKDQAIIQFGREMLRGPKVSSKTFAQMERLFGRRGTLAITLFMIYYQDNALLFRAYDQRLDPGLKRPFPDVLAREAKNR
jgi:carboxymuconolactone decarboxylase family protein